MNGYATVTTRLNSTGSIVTFSTPFGKSTQQHVDPFGVHFFSDPVIILEIPEVGIGPCEALHFGDVGGAVTNQL